MDPETADILFGCAVLTAALGCLTALVLWSRRIIERVARRGGGSAREILRDLDERE